MTRDAFSDCHPYVQLLFFAAVLGFTMTITHPVCLFFSFAAGLAYYTLLAGGKGLQGFFSYALPAAFLAAVLNPLFNHGGSVVLFMLPGGNPFTLESLFYGIYAAFLLLSAFLWFACFSIVMKSDRLIYLFGRVMPAFSLLICMVLRFIPYYTQRFREVREAGRMLQTEEDESFASRMKSLRRSFSVMTELSLSGAVVSADSMKSRGYGLPGRSSYAPYRMTSKDRSLLCFLLFIVLFLLSSAISGQLFFRYFPSLRGVFTAPLTLISEVFLLLLYLTPLILRGKEVLQWRSLN